MNIIIIMVELNTEHWPIVYFRSVNKIMNDELFEEYQKIYLNLLIKCKKNNKKMILITDLTNNSNDNNIPIKYLIKQVQFSNKIYEFNKKYLECVVILCKNKSFKNLIKLVISLLKQPSPHKICTNYAKANLYLLEKFNINFNIQNFNKEKDLNIDEEESEDNNDLNSINNNDLNAINNDDENISNQKILNEYFNELSI